MSAAFDGAALLEKAPVALLVVDMNGEVLAHNRTTNAWLGETVTSLAGRNLTEWFTPAARLLYETQVVPRLVETGHVRELVLEVRRATGTRHPLLVNADRRLTTDGTPYIVIAAVEATARVGFEYELVETRRAADAAHRELSLLQEATGRLAVASGIDDLGDVLVDASSAATQAAWAEVRLLSSDGTVARWGTAPLDDVDERLSVGPDQVIARNLDDIEALLPDQYERLQRVGVESLVVTPIVRTAGDGATVLGDLRCWFRRPRSLGPDESGTLVALALQAERVIEHLRLQDRLRHSASHDSLTGLPNRVGFAERVDRVLSRVAAERTSCAVLFLDLDGFKAINDERGHGAGDEVLRTVADRLSRSCRPGDAVGRLGGDEFLIAVEGVDDDEALAFAQRVLDVVRLPLDGAAAGLPLSTSVGVITWDARGGGEAPSAADLIAAADAEMYDVKRGGRDGIRVRAWEGEQRSS
ncbi:diguanylate cyclase domain-containing protein [Streptomyces sp. AC495_CC817]|uniref:diguanylate cyclase domain-containing protein n=1 Tax=Streptomyces sp. AC495_CC817 TaxID=2823900 RepID=UPI001C27333A|nr:diguanylate cyclase [Streptomyces sp. AC495_CC817]